MRYILRHEAESYLRFHIPQFEMEMQEADKLEYYLKKVEAIDDVRVNERTCDVLIYHHDKDEVLKALQDFSYDQVSETIESGRALQRKGEEDIFWHLSRRAVSKLLFPAPIRSVFTVCKAVRFVAKGIKVLLAGKMEVAVLDATAISAAILTGDQETASSIMFLLGLSEILEDWTRKKSEDDLARSLALNVDKIWTLENGKEKLKSVMDVKQGDLIIVRKGGIIPLDGVVEKGTISVNQASMTGESIAVAKQEGLSVFAGTVVEDGEAVIRVSNISGDSRYDRIIEMIRNSEKLKSSLEDRAFAFSDKLVPVSLGLTALVYLFTRNISKAMSVLMVDYSCALKLSMPIAVLSAMQEAGRSGITIKGGRYLENYAKADTIVFDKTGTLTYCEPKLADIITFSSMDKDEALRISACMEEHYPHSIANAIVAAAKKKGLDHDKELHSRIEYVVAHGVAATINRKKVLLGSYHFVFEDNKCRIPEKEKEKFESLPKEYSHLFLSISGKLAAVICIEDPIRPEAKDVIAKLKKLGISNTVMMTGDNAKTAQAVARETGISRCYSEVLPSDKADYVLKEKENGHTVIMLGDGINDSPALSAADAGVAISQGAPIARQIADITINGEDLGRLVELRLMSLALQKKIENNYRFIMTFNSALILAGLLSLITPASAAYLHNISTLLVSAAATRPLKKEEKKLQLNIS